MDKENFQNFYDMIGGLFNQDFDCICGNIENAVEMIFLDYPKTAQFSLYNEINEILKITENEENLEKCLDETFCIDVTPQSPGIDMNTYTELLEYIRDRLGEHLKKKKNEELI